MSETRKLSMRYARLGREVIESEPLLAGLKASDARIAFLESDAEKVSRGRRVYGCCEKVPDKIKWAVPYDFLVTVYAPNAALLDEGAQRVLLYHELLHAGVGHDKDGNERYSIVPHDVEDFREVVERWGMDWAGGKLEAPPPGAPA